VLKEMESEYIIMGTGWKAPAAGVYILLGRHLEVVTALPLTATPTNTSPQLFPVRGKYPLTENIQDLTIIRIADKSS